MKDYIKKNLMYFIFAVIFYILLAICTLLFSFELGNIIEGAVAVNENLYTKILYGVCILITIFIINNIASYFRRKFVNSTTFQYKNDLAYKIFSFSYEDFYQNNNSYYTNVLTNEADIVSDQYFGQLSYIAFNGIQLVVSMGGLFFISYYLGLVMMLFILLFLFIPNIFGKKLNKINKSLSSMNENILSYLKSVFSGFDIIKTFNIVEKTTDDYSDKNISRENIKQKFKATDDIKDISIELLAFVMMLSIISVGSLILSNGLITISYLFASIQLINNIINPISQLFMRLTTLQGTKAVRKRHLDLLQMKNKERDNLVDITSIKNISIQDLSFGYDESLIFDNFNYKFLLGHKYAIIGKSGCGKSTLLRLIAGYFNTYKGNIFYDNYALKGINKKSLYENLSMIQQDVFIFDDTFSNNIMLGKDVDKDVYDKIIDITNLGLVEERYKENVILRDNGKTLSGGEKQRIAIARSLILKSKILLIDEATSSLDPENTDMINKILFGLKDVTCIIVTHNQDPKYLSNFDEVLELNK